jgi:hypothetical protein
MSPIARNFLKFSFLAERPSFIPVSAMPAFRRESQLLKKEMANTVQLDLPRMSSHEGYHPYLLHHTPFVKDWPLPRQKNSRIVHFFFSLIHTPKADILYISTLYEMECL